jgi:hypothetical protein
VSGAAVDVGDTQGEFAFMRRGRVTEVQILLNRGMGCKALVRCRSVGWGPLDRDLKKGWGFRSPGWGGLVAGWEVVPREINSALGFVGL